MSKEAKMNEKKQSNDNNLFSIRCLDVSNKTIDSLSDIDESNNKDISNISISYAWDLMKEKNTPLNPFIENIEYNAHPQAQLQSTFEKSPFQKSKFKDKESSGLSSQKNSFYKQIERNEKIENAKSSNELSEMNNLDSKSPIFIEKLRSITPKIDRFTSKNVGSTRSITPIDKLEREQSQKGILMEKKNLISEKREEGSKDTKRYENKNKENYNDKNAGQLYLQKKLSSISNNSLNEFNEENIGRKLSAKISEDKIKDKENENFKITAALAYNNYHKNYNQNENKGERYDETRKKLDSQVRNLEKETEEKNKTIRDLKSNLKKIEQENIELKEELRQYKSLYDEEYKKNQNKYKHGIQILEEENKTLNQKIYDIKVDFKKRLEEKNEQIDLLQKELSKLKMNNSKCKPQYDSTNKTSYHPYLYDAEQKHPDSPDSAGVQKSYFKKPIPLTKNRTSEETDTSNNNMHNNNINNSKTEGVLKNNDDFFTKRKYEEKLGFLGRLKESGLKNAENSNGMESSCEKIDFIQKQSTKNSSNLKTTPDNLSSKRNQKMHVSPIDFPSSRNRDESSKFLEKPPPYLNMNSRNNVNYDRFRNGPHYKRDETDSRERDLSGNKVSEYKSSDYRRKMEDINNFDSDSYIKNLTRSNNGNGASLKNQENIKLQYSPEKFKKNIETLNDIGKRCQTSSNSNTNNMKKVNQILKEKEKLHKNLEIKNTLPKPNKSNEKMYKNYIFKEDKSSILSTQGRRCSLNESDSVKGKPILNNNFIENCISSKKERSKSIMSENNKEILEKESIFDNFYRASPTNK